MDTQNLSCAVCGHSWNAAVDSDPKRCSSPKCRSLLWKTGKETAKPAAIYGVRVDEDRKGQFERAARAAGKTVTGWLLDLGIAEVSPPKVDHMGAMQRKDGGHAAGLPVAERSAAPIKELVYEYDEGGPVEDVPGPGITKPTAVQVEKPVRTLEQLMASGEVTLGFGGSTAAPSEPELEGTAAPAADHPEVDGW